jgi:hypothetical protein
MKPDRTAIRFHLSNFPELFRAGTVMNSASMNSASSEEQYKNIGAPLEMIAAFSAVSATDEPVQFVRDLAHRWKERGGTVAGKSRHSDRYLDDLLRLHGTPIKSLTPKLAGRTNLKPADAGVLLRLFLSHWEYVGDPNSGEIGERSSDLYTPLLAEDEIEGVSRYIENRIFEMGSEARIAIEPATALSMPGQDTIDLIAAEFQEAAALFTVGAGQAMLVPRPEMALIGFRNLFNQLWTIDKADDRERILIWTLDLGRQDFDDPESRLRFMNVEALIARFKALKRFKESVTEARWDWLQSRTVIVLHDTRSVRPDVPRLPAFDPHHVLFSAIPPRWAGSQEFLTLYGTERLNETVYTIFLKRLAGESLDARKSLDRMSAPSGSPYQLHYFGHAVLNSDGVREARGLKLGAPGRSYVEALGTVYMAAAQLLGLLSRSAEVTVDGMKIDSAYAAEKLRHHGFSLLRLDEFIAF